MATRILICLALLIAGALASTVVFPTPGTFTCVPDTQLHPLASGFKLSWDKNMSILSHGIDRYQTYIASLAVAAPANGITNIEFLVSDHSEEWTEDTSYTVTFTTSSSKLQISAPNQFGALYALETVVQLLENGGFNCSSINLLDKPAFHHRGLLVDTASRFVPVGTLKTIIDAMLMAKMNVLNMRVAGNGAVRVESSFPELTAHVDGFYTSDDITSLVEYAHLRGVMIIPEISVPDQAMGFAPSPKFSFCASSAQLAGTDNVTLAVIAFATDLIKQFGPAARIFIGGLHSAQSSDCDANFKDLVSKTVAALLNELPKPDGRVGGWDELLGGINATDRNQTVVFSRQSQDAVKKLVAVGSPVIYAGKNRSFFLDTDSDGAFGCTDLPCLYAELAQFTTGPNSVHGVSASALTSKYCSSKDCLPGNEAPSAAALAPRSQDAVFSKSLVALIFPRAAVVGAAGWSYDESQLDAGANSLTASMKNRGVGVCPTGCVCTEAAQCGSAYVTSATPGPVKVMQGGMIFAVVLLVVFTVVIVVAVARSSRSRSGYSRVN